jgi:hypothetical protein
MIQIFESWYIPVWHKRSNIWSSVEKFQSRQWPWVSFPNLPLLCLLLCARTTSPPFLSFTRCRRLKRLMGLTWTNISGSSWSFSWIQVTQLKVPSIANTFYLLGWIPRGLDQLGDGLPRDCEPDALKGTFWQVQEVLDFLEGSSLVLFWSSSKENIKGRRLRGPRQSTHRTSDYRTLHRIRIHL